MEISEIYGNLWKYLRFMETSEIYGKLLRFMGPDWDLWRGYSGDTVGYSGQGHPRTRTTVHYHTTHVPPGTPLPGYPTTSPAGPASARVPVHACLRARDQFARLLPDTVHAPTEVSTGIPDSGVHGIPDSDVHGKTSKRS